MKVIKPVTAKLGAATFSLNIGPLYCLCCYTEYFVTALNCLGSFLVARWRYKLENVDVNPRYMFIDPSTELYCPSYYCTIQRFSVRLGVHLILYTIWLIRTFREFQIKLRFYYFRFQIICLIGYPYQFNECWFTWLGHLLPGECL